jgi:hypothetical protein
MQQEADWILWLRRTGKCLGISIVVSLLGLHILKEIWKDQLLTEGKRILSGIEAFRRQQGRYPRSLEEAGITANSKVVASTYYLPPKRSADFSITVRNFFGSWSFFGQEREWWFDSSSF